MAGTQSAGLMAAQYEAMSKRMQHGFAARNGYYAAGLAAAGYTGIKRSSTVPTAATSRCSAKVTTRIRAGDRRSRRGLAHRGDHGEILCRPGRFARHDPGGAGAARRARIDPKAVSHIEIRVGHTVYHHGWWPPERPLTSIGAQMNSACGGGRLARRAGLPPQFTDERLDADDVWDLLGKVEVTLDDNIQNGPVQERFATELTITRGRHGPAQAHRATARRAARPGHQRRPDRQVPRPGGPADAATRLDAIQAAVLGIDELSDFGTWRDCCPRPSPAPWTDSDRWPRMRPAGGCEQPSPPAN